MKEKALFLSNRLFLDASLPEGGVKFCTDEYLSLLQERFDVLRFPVEYSSSFMYRLSRKTGLSAYNDYIPSRYATALKETIAANDVSHVFINMTNAATFAPIIKSLNEKIKVILCSHGNESGDFLHDVAGHSKYRGLTNKIAKYMLGKMLVKEYALRKYIDLVLTVSEVEENIEKWLGAKQVVMVPRSVRKRSVPGHPVAGRVGFVADLSHEPNHYGITVLCAALAKENTTGIVLRLIGSGEERGKALQQQYPFVQYEGRLSEAALQQEMSTWTFALNPVFYYSRGVSTKLGKVLEAGIPAITTDKGMRGYRWKEGNLPVCSNENEMGALIIKLANNEAACSSYRREVEKIQQSAPGFPEIMNEISKII